MREEEGLEIHVISQVDTMAHKIRGFIEKAGRAGVDRVFIGLENINPNSLKDGCTQGPEPHHRVSRHAPGMAPSRDANLCGLPGDTPGNDGARYSHHREGAAG